MSAKYENTGNTRRLGSRFIRNFDDLQFRDGSRPYYRDPKTGAVRSVRRDAIRVLRRETAKARKTAAAEAAAKKAVR